MVEDTGEHLDGRDEEGMWEGDWNFHVSFGCSTLPVSPHIQHSGSSMNTLLWGYLWRLPSLALEYKMKQGKGEQSFAKRTHWLSF